MLVSPGSILKAWAKLEPEKGLFDIMLSKKSFILRELDTLWRIYFPICFWIMNLGVLGNQYFQLHNVKKYKFLMLNQHSPQIKMVYGRELVKQMQ